MILSIVTPYSVKTCPVIGAIFPGNVQWKCSVELCCTVYGSQVFNMKLNFKNKPTLCHGGLQQERD